MKELEDTESEQKQFGVVVDENGLCAARVEQVHHQQRHEEHENVVGNLHDAGV
jgi:hypothetical protein